MKILKFNEELQIPRSGIRGDVVKSTTSYKIYLAGPDVFRANAISRLNSLKRMSGRYGHEGLAPLDNMLIISDDQKNTPAHSKIIFEANVDLIERCDVIVANLEPFRGPGVDDGTAWEIGYGYAKGKKIWGYSQLSDKTLVDITKMMFDMTKQKRYPEIENMGNTTNLMIIDSIKASGGNIFKTFEECLIDINKSFEECLIDINKS
jgi:nucleoside 2-deoxyribosyltransferase